jgi:hypothetical protein
LSLLLAKHTAMTKSGLMALAANPILKVNAGDQFPPDVMTEFEVVQRRSTRCASKTVTPSDADAQAARSVLLGFFAAISQWERDVAQSTAPGSGETDWRIERCRAIFAEFCTPKDRKYGRPNALHCSIPPDYETLQLLDVEWPTLRKVLFYTKDRNGFQHRFLVVKQRDRWLVDHKETLLDGWSRAYL